MHTHTQRILNTHCITSVYQNNNADCWTVTGLHRLVQPRPWCLIGHIFSCHDCTAKLVAIGAQCQKRTKWGMLYLSTTENIYTAQTSGQLNLCQVTLDWATISQRFAYMGTLRFTAISQLSCWEGCHIPSTSLARAAWRCCLWVKQLFQTLALRSGEERNNSGGYLQTSHWYTTQARGWDWHGEWLTIKDVHLKNKTLLLQNSNTANKTACFHEMINDIDLTADRAQPVLIWYLEVLMCLTKSIPPSCHLLCLYTSSTLPAVMRWKQGYSLDKSSAQGHLERQTNIHTLDSLPFSMDNLEFPICLTRMFCWRKPKTADRTSTRRTWKTPQNSSGNMLHLNILNS